KEVHFLYSDPMSQYLPSLRKQDWRTSSEVARSDHSSNLPSLAFVKSRRLISVPKIDIAHPATESPSSRCNRIDNEYGSAPSAHPAHQIRNCRLRWFCLMICGKTTSRSALKCSG